MGSADYYASGQWNFYCDLCGRKQKSGNAMKTWDGFYVCKSHKEKRNPQDFIKGVLDDQSIPWSRTNSGFDSDVPSTTNRLMQESGNAILQQDGTSFILLES